MSEGRAYPIHVIGVDDSGPAGLSANELRLVEEADLLCGGRRHLALFEQASAERLTITSDLEALYRRLGKVRSARAVVLASGDPCFYGIGPLIAARMGRERVVIHPHAGSVALAFARLGVAHEDATVLSVHGRPIGGSLPRALGAQKLAILTDAEHTPALVATWLLGAGMPDCPTYVCERLGGPMERIHELSLASLPGRDFDPVNVLVLLPGAERQVPAALGRSEQDYVSVRGQVSKAEVRAVTVSRLEPWRTEVCWDVGAGSGSVAIETAALMPWGTVYAVERDEEQLQALRQNVFRYRAARVEVVAGEAPDALARLPAPDAVFVGGGGSALAAILSCAVGRLRPGGRLVANFALLESLATWQAVARDAGWPAEVSEIAVARAAPLGAGSRLKPLGPVFVTTLRRPEPAG